MTAVDPHVRRRRRATGAETRPPASVRRWRRRQRWRRRRGRRRPGRPLSIALARRGDLGRIPAGSRNRVRSLAHASGTASDISRRRTRVRNAARARTRTHTRTRARARTHATESRCSAYTRHAHARRDSLPSARALYTGRSSRRTCTYVNAPRRCYMIAARITAPAIFVAIGHRSRDVTSERNVARDHGRPIGSHSRYCRTNSNVPVLYQSIPPDWSERFGAFL